MRLRALQWQGCCPGNSTRQHCRNHTGGSGGGNATCNTHLQLVAPHCIPLRGAQVGHVAGAHFGGQVRRVGVVCVIVAAAHRPARALQGGGGGEGGKQGREGLTGLQWEPLALPLCCPDASVHAGRCAGVHGGWGAQWLASQFVFVHQGGQFGKIIDITDACAHAPHGAFKCV